MRNAFALGFDSRYLHVGPRKYSSSTLLLGLGFPRALAQMQQASGFWPGFVLEEAHPKTGRVETQVQRPV